MRGFLVFVCLFSCVPVIVALPADGPGKQAEFKVKYVESGTVYLDGGRTAGLSEGMKLVIKRERAFGAASGDGQFKATVVVAKLTVISVSNTSAMCQVRSRSLAVQKGDVATLVEGRAGNQGGQRVAAPGAQSLNQEMRTSVLAPAMATMGSETARPVQPPPSSAPASIADAARANRNRLEQERAAQAASPPPSRAIVATVPLSVAEAARARQHQGPASGPPKQRAQATATSLTPLSSGTPNQPVATAANHPAIPGPATNPPEVDTKKAQASGQRATASEAAATATVTPASKPHSASPAASSATNRAAQAAHTAEPLQNSPQVLAQSSPTEPRDKIVVSSPTQKTAGAALSTSTPALAAQNIPSANVSPASLSAVPGKTAFNVKYVAEDAVYIDAGRNAGLAEGMELTVKKSDTVIAKLAVVSVSNTSAVCEIHNKTADIQSGDVALLSQGDQDKMAQMQTMGPTRKYPQVIAFSQGDPLDEEVRASVPKPPLPEVNRARGRIGMDYTFINNRGTGATTSSQIGAVVRADITRIWGSHWNLNGYWRGRLNTFSSSAQPQSVADLINRTYTIGFTYANPSSHWTAGVGRLYLPWAPSLDTLDGGYLGVRFGSHTTVGIFGGTTPDPTSFDYNPDRRTAGTFVAIEAGSFDKLRFTSAEGVAVSALGWREDRQFIFGENGLFYKRFLSIYHSAQADIQRLPTGGTTEGLSRSFATLRVQPISWFSIDVNHNYFRDVPTFDPALVGTGLLDKFLFQGVSLGSRLELPGHISLYDNFGQSNRSGDPRKSINQLYGLTLGRLWKTGLRGDVRYSKFNSSFGQGDYRAASLSRSFGDVFRVEVNAGRQNFLSSIGTPTDYRLLGTTVDLNLGGHYFVESSMNLQRSSQQNFDQWLITTGYRFDTRKGK